MYKTKGWAQKIISTSLPQCWKDYWCPDLSFQSACHQSFERRRNIVLERSEEDLSNLLTNFLHSLS